jgi:glycosyltransferase involved in cell wall biosynthesis
MKLFWFSKYATQDSFSRVGENLLKCLGEFGYEFYSIVPPQLVQSSKDLLLKQFKSCAIMGSEIRYQGKVIMTFEQLKKDANLNGDTSSELALKMKYTFLQALYFCFENDIKRLLILMGVYEANWFMQIAHTLKKIEKFKVIFDFVKIILYTPFDYIPTYDTIKYYTEADYVITTIPTIIPVIKELTGIEKINYVGHGNDPVFKRYENKALVISLLNSMLKLDPPITSDDIIILNANQYGPRKRIETTVNVFKKLINKHPDLKLKLWLHSGQTTASNVDEIPKDKIIITKKLESKYMNLMYNACQISLSSTWGEGWGLTSCEHSMTHGLQVVPNFLGTKYHFEDGRGILIPVDEVEHYNEGNTAVTIGMCSEENILKSLEEAIELVRNGGSKEYTDRAFEYISKYTWSTEAYKMHKILMEI